VAAGVTTHTTLLARLADRDDQTAWREFAERYGELIRGVARRHNLQAADCEDVLQEVLIGLSRLMPGFRYDPARGRFRTFLRTLVLRAIYRRFRQKGDQPPQSYDEAGADAVVEDPSLEQAWEQEWQQYHVRRAMQVIVAEFGPADRAAFDAYVVEGGDARQTADALGLSVDSVYQAKSRILRRLTQLVEEQVQEEG